MKKLRILLAMMAVLAGVAVVSSCSDDDDDDPRLETDKTSTGLTFAADATAAQIINVTSDVSGAITATPKDSWVKTVVNGKAISVTVDPNTTEVERKSSITLSASGFSSVTVNVNQSAGGGGPSALLKVTPTSYDFPAAGETKAFTVTTELEGWEVALTGDSAFSIEEKTATQVKVKAIANTSETNTPSGTLTFTHADLDAPVTVALTQKAKAVVAAKAVKYYDGTAKYHGDVAGTGAGIFQVDFVTDDRTEVIYLEGGTVKAANSSQFALADGEYTIVDTGAVRTIYPGSAADEENDFRSYVKINDEIIYITGGTMTVSSSTYNSENGLNGLFVDMNFTGKKKNGGEEVTDLKYTFGTSDAPANMQWRIWEMATGSVEAADLNAIGGKTGTATGTPGAFINPAGPSPFNVTFGWLGGTNPAFQGWGGQSSVIFAMTLYQKNLVVNEDNAIFRTSSGEFGYAVAATFNDQGQILDRVYVCKDVTFTKPNKFRFSGQYGGKDVLFGIVKLDTSTGDEYFWTDFYKDVDVTINTTRGTASASFINPVITVGKDYVSNNYAGRINMSEHMVINTEFNSAISRW